jgi:uncharacterized protein (DUF58 family)
MTASTQSADLNTQSWTFDGVVRLTNVGTTFLIFTLVIGFAALNTGNNALYIGLTFLLGCLLLSGLASKGGLKHLEVEMFDAGDAWAGRPVDVRLRVVNRSRIWNVRDVVITGGDLVSSVLIAAVPKQSQATAVAAFSFARRGHVELKTLDLYTRYPFGLFLKKRRIRVRGDLVVFPRLLDESIDRDAFRPVSGEQITSNRPGPGSDIHSFREYVRGDSLRHVYWKKSASLGRWIMKQTEQEATRVVHVFVDPYRPRGTTDEQFEEMISVATTFVHDALTRGLDVVLQLPRVTMRSKHSQAGHTMFRALALLEASHEPVHQPVDRGTLIFSLAKGVSREPARA